MVSQRELIQETFADVVRGIGAMAKTMAPGLVNAYKDVYAPIKTFRSKQPVYALREKLKTEYFNTFDYKSVKIGKPTTLPNDPQGGSRISIPFTAKRIKKVSIQKSIGTGTLQGGTENEQLYTAILTRSKKGVDGEYNVEIRNSKNNVIQPNQNNLTQSKINQKTWDEIKASIRTYSKFNKNIVLREIAANTKFSLQTLKNDYELNIAIDKDIANGKVKLPETLKYLKSKYIANKKIIESYKPTQLQLIENSYNMRYEVSIDKGN